MTKRPMTQKEIDDEKASWLEDGKSLAAWQNYRKYFIQLIEEKPMKPDPIYVYTIPDAPESQKVRWTRKSVANGKVIASSSEGYARNRGAIANIERTQREPYVIIKVD